MTQPTVEDLAYLAAKRFCYTDIRDWAIAHKTALEGELLYDELLAKCTLADSDGKADTGLSAIVASVLTEMKAQTAQVVP